MAAHSDHLPEYEVWRTKIRESVSSPSEPH